VARLMVPAFFGIGLYQINFFVDTVFAMSPKMPAGSITSLYVADRVVELVLGSFAIAVSTALLPTLSRQVIEERVGDMKVTFAYALRLVSFITFPAAVGMILLRQPILRVLFEHGRFAADSTSLTARPLLYYALGLPAFAAVKILVPVFYSLRDTATPVRVAAAALGVNITLNTVFLLWLLRSLANGGPALATSVAAYVNFGALFVMFRRRFGRVGARALVLSLGRIVLCTAGMGLACAAMPRFLGFDTMSHTAAQAVALAAMIVTSVALYLGAARILGCEELGEVLAFVRAPRLAAGNRV